MEGEIKTWRNRGVIVCVLIAAMLVADSAGGGRMDDRRKSERTEVNEPAYVSSGGSVMRCMVRNISPEGASIEVDEPAFVPSRFRLVMANDASHVHECRVAWIQKNRIGLSFVAAD